MNLRLNLNESAQIYSMIHSFSKVQTIQKCSCKMLKLMG